MQRTSRAKDKNPSREKQQRSQNRIYKDTGRALWHGRNDGAPEIAKGATELEPATETTTIAKLHRQLHDKLNTAWISEWAREPMTGRCAISYAFHTLDRRTIGIVTPARIRHGRFGEYYQTHNTREPANCPCGAELQTRKHIVFECQAHGEYGDYMPCEP